MAKKKLQRFAEIETFHNVFKHVQIKREVIDFELKGKWLETYFKNKNPIVLELGCGKGEYTVGLAEKNPGKNFIGIDLKGNRIWLGSRQALDKKLANVAFVRSRIENIETLFAADEINEIWITFPDPQPGEKRAKKRLTHPRMLNKYKNILQQDGTIHLKTDNKELFEYTLSVIRENKHRLLYHTFNLYAEKEKNNVILDEARMIKTHYEKMFSEKGFDICYLKFELQ